MHRQAVSTVAIARKVGVAQSTVSNILNNAPDFKYSEETRDRVLRAADELGYYTQSLRRAIKRSLNQFGFVVSNPDALEKTYMGEVMKGIRQTALEQGYQFMFCEADWRLGDEEDTERATNKLIDLVKGKVLEGLLIDKSRFGSEQMALLEEAKVPFVCLNGRLPQMAIETDVKAHWVCVNHIHGGRLATQYLIEKGHRRIALINPGMSQYPTEYLPGVIGDRIKGYREALRQSGIPEIAELCVESSLTDRTLIYQAVDRLLDRPERPTAIFAADDAIAILAINRLRQRGLRVPQDISVIGYGNWGLAFVADPPLTTLDVPWTAMGRQAVRMLIDRVRGKPPAENIVVLNAALMEGESVAACAL